MPIPRRRRSIDGPPIPKTDTETSSDTDTSPDKRPRRSGDGARDSRRRGNKKERRPKGISARDAKKAAEIRAWIESRKASETTPEESMVTESESPKGSVKTIDADKMPDGKLVKLSDFERAKFEDGDILKYSGAMASVAALGYLGYKAGAHKAYIGWKALPVFDAVARGVEGIADKLINKNLPGLKWLVRPTVWAMDKTSKLLGLDKSLYQHLKKHKEDRKKLAQKLVEDLRKSEERYERDVDRSKKQKKREEEREKKRFERLATAFGPEVAHMMVYEMEQLEELMEELESKDEDSSEDES